jgi:hypothetical protein
LGLVVAGSATAAGTVHVNASKSDLSKPIKVASIGDPINVNIKVQSDNAGLTQPYVEIKEPKNGLTINPNGIIGAEMSTDGVNWIKNTPSENLSKDYFFTYDVFDECYLWDLHWVTGDLAPYANVQLRIPAVINNTGQITLNSNLYEHQKKEDVWISGDSYSFQSKYPTNIIVNDISGHHNDIVKLSATLNKNANPLAGKTVTFAINGWTGKATTNKVGVAVLNYHITQSPGKYTIKASFAGDDDYQSSSNTGILRVVKDTRILLVSNVSGDQGSKVNLKATLLDRNNNPVTGKTVTFKVNGVSIGGFTTNNKGQAIKNYSVNFAKGQYTITANYTGDIYYSASTGKGTLTVLKNLTYLNAANATVKKGKKVNIIAKLLDKSQKPISSKNLTFKVNGVSIGSATTNNKGQAIKSYIVKLKPGIYTIITNYNGDKNYRSSSGKSILKVIQ